MKFLATSAMRRILSMAAIAVAAVSLSACQTAPAANTTPAPAPVVAETTINLMLKLRSEELALERLDKMAMLKYADESGSDLVKGFVMGQMGSKASAGGASSTTQTLMQAQAQADNVALRREEMAYANSWDKRLLPYVGLGLDAWQFGKNLSQQKWNTTEANAQSRYTLDTLTNAQTSGYSFAAGAYSAGSSATLGGVSAGASAASAGAAAVSASAAVAPAVETE